eukprot:CAMPEP_0118925458 /NCGR_PEP_ID=MMETSP1169-20130426/3345_1 /TAXON_ID=36882 /ORGANISM="Pyramimonas obovata, Strain CCMP722" /LENGTH=193 /DNA_ID=CAMNT_0006866765 /DNA_START=228 /DNA_END=805 /DNA_ORIENTATION=+
MIRTCQTRTHYTFLVAYARQEKVSAVQAVSSHFRRAVYSRSNHNQLSHVCKLSVECKGQTTDAEDHAYMQLAYSQALKAYDEREVPVGAVIVHDGRVVAEAHNITEQTGDPTAHAEMLCIRQAASALGGWRQLREAILYVTLEPCVMCAGALLQARMGTIVYGAPNHLLGGDGSWVSLFNSGGENVGEERVVP